MKFHVLTARKHVRHSNQDVLVLEVCDFDSVRYPDPYPTSRWVAFMDRGNIDGLLARGGKRSTRGKFASLGLGHPARRFTQRLCSGETDSACAIP